MQAMQHAEFLTLLTARAKRLETDRIRGGRPALTSDDMNWLLKKMRTEEGRNYIRVKYCDQQQFVPMLLLHMRWHMRIDCQKHRWRLPKKAAVLDKPQPLGFEGEHKDFLLRAARMMLAEAIEPAICRTCFGRQQVINERGQKIFCARCKGAGTRDITGIDRAEFLGLQHPSWFQTWKARYRRWQIGLVDAWEHDWNSLQG